MPISNVALTNTFDEWRTTTNQLVTTVNDILNDGAVPITYRNLTANTVSANNINIGSIALTSNGITLSTIVSNVITANSITVINISSSIVNANVITANTIRAINISSNVISTNVITTNTITALNISSNVISTNVITTNTIIANSVNLNGINVQTYIISSFDRANTANITADAAFGRANAANLIANLAFDKANTANITADAAFGQANVARTHANSAFANANSAGIVASAAFDAANAAGSPVVIAAAFGRANTANITADAAFSRANAANLIANLAFDKANTANVTACAAFDKANTANITADAAFVRANAANLIANLAFDRANSANITAISAFAKANAGGGGNFNTNLSAAVGYSVTSTMASAYTAAVTSGYRYIVHSIHITNIDTANANISGEFSGTTYSSIAFANGVPVPAGSAVELLKKPKVMQPSDELRLREEGTSANLHATIVYETQQTTNYFGAGVDVTSDATYTDLYTATGNAVLESILLSNDSDLYDVKARVIWTDGSNNTQGYFCYDLIIPLQSTVELLQMPKYLPSGYKVRVYANIGGRLEAIIAGKLI